MSLGVGRRVRSDCRLSNTGNPSDSGSVTGVLLHPILAAGYMVSSVELCQESGSGDELRHTDPWSWSHSVSGGFG